MMDTNTPNTLKEQSEESMEEILASIRKIMEPDTQASLPQNPPILSPSVDALGEATETSLEAKKLTADVLVLNKKTPGKNLEPQDNLSQKIEREETALPASPPPAKSPLENLVTSSLTPLIHAWLEKNLPNIVEKVVKEEIKKLLDPRIKLEK